MNADTGIHQIEMQLSLMNLIAQMITFLALLFASAFMTCTAQVHRLYGEASLFKWNQCLMVWRQTANEPHQSLIFRQFRLDISSIDMIRRK